MGSDTDPLAVVDHNANIFGLENIRNIDASIMPSNISGNLNAPTIMMAEKLADVVKKKEQLRQEKYAPVYTPDNTKQR